MKSIHALLLSAVLAAMSPPAHAGLPVTRPTFRIEPVPAGGSDNVGGGSLFASPRLVVTFVGRIDDEMLQALQDRLSELRVVKGKRWYSLVADIVGADKMRISVHSPSVNSFTGPDSEPPAGGDLALALNEALEIDTQPPSDARRAEIDRLQTESDQLKASRTLLTTMISSRAKQDERSLADRLRDWRTTAATVDEQMQAKQFRHDALVVRRNQLIFAQAKAREDDPVIVELKKIVELRQQKLARAEEQVKANVMSASELLDTRLAVSEAQLRLAERQASVTPSGTVAALDQLSQEIINVSVDLDEMKLKRWQLEEKLKPYIPSKATTQSLARAVQVGELSADEAKANQLYWDLTRQSTALRTKLLSLKLSKIEAAE